jgi:hypothetical protein
LFTHLDAFSELNENIKNAIWDEYPHKHYLIRKK